MPAWNKAPAHDLDNAAITLITPELTICMSTEINGRFDLPRVCDAKDRCSFLGGNVRRRRPVGCEGRVSRRPYMCTMQQWRLLFDRTLFDRTCSHVQKLENTRQEIVENRRRKR